MTLVCLANFIANQVNMKKTSFRKAYLFIKDGVWALAEYHQSRFNEAIVDPICEKPRSYQGEDYDFEGEVTYTTVADRDHRLPILKEKMRVLLQEKIDRLQRLKAGLDTVQLVSQPKPLPTRNWLKSLSKEECLKWTSPLRLSRSGEELAVRFTEEGCFSLCGEVRYFLWTDVLALDLDGDHIYASAKGKREVDVVVLWENGLWNFFNPEDKDETAD